MYSIPNTEWYVLKNNVRKWNYDARPLPKNVHWVAYYEPNKYDFAVLHVDQQCVDPRLGKAQLYNDLNNTIQDIPKIVINHGTPFWIENFESGHNTWKLDSDVRDNEQKKLEWEIRFLIEGGKIRQGDEVIEIAGMKKMIGNNRMVVNSYEAKRQWGWGEVIWHGLASDEWKTKDKEPRAVTQLSPAGLDYYYGRELLSSTATRLRDDFGDKHIWISKDWTFNLHPRLSEMGALWCYKDFLARSLVYFNPTKESPMPRSRTEAMLSGCCIVTTAYQDADLFINTDVRKIWELSTGITDFIDNIEKVIANKDINGLIIPENPLAISALIDYLIRNPRIAIRIGEKGRQTALKLFDKNKYDNKWFKIMEETCKR